MQLFSYFIFKTLLSFKEIELINNRYNYILDRIRRSKAVKLAAKFIALLSMHKLKALIILTYYAVLLH
ncbi:hypothetical protein HBH65_175100 [Parastagonospora nodorum]|nr:hypothetical protein HBI02_181530 [Parastagonospora nodorum]KAH4503182.1 hypothetical protein HBH87_170700 [Parastagonospora nodorum]KAH4566380.1 hypothetical protein HBH83_242940 [Parastagonospora nodorum]KAH4754264.1 hypothetical protein HBH65_175100 [Parastagonospora nodorum]